MDIAIPESQALSMSKIRDAIESMRFDARNDAAAYFWEYVPQDQPHGQDAELAYIISAMPGAGRYPASAIASLLASEASRRKQAFRPAPRSYKFSLPSLAGRAMVEDPGLCLLAMEAVKRRTRVPPEIRSDHMWLLQLAIACSIGLVSGRGMAPVECSRQTEPLLHGHALIERLDQLVRHEAETSKGAQT